MKNNCCFCGTDLKDFGNSTWPIYIDADGEKNRCCNECNQKYVIEARRNPIIIMSIREKFNIKYANM